MDAHKPTPETCRVSRFDGQSIWSADDEVLYELGNYLGGGISGVVYEATDQQTEANNVSSDPRHPHHNPSPPFCGWRAWFGALVSLNTAHHTGQLHSVTAPPSSSTLQSIIVLHLHGRIRIA